MSPGWRRSFLWVALVTFIVVAYKLYSDQAGGRLDQGLKKLKAEAKGKLPIKIDEFITLVDLTMEPRKNIYWYVMEVRDGEKIDRQKLKQMSQNQACGNADALRAIKEKGFTYEYRYTDKVRATLAVFTITNCP